MLIVSPTFGAYGGMEAFVLALLDALPSTNDLDVRACFKRVPGRALDGALARRCEDPRVQVCDAASPALWSAIRWADLVHAQHPSPDVTLMAKLMRTPLVVTLHNVRPSGPAWRVGVWHVAARAAAARWYNSAYVRSTWEGDRRHPGSAVVPPLAPSVAAAPVPPHERRGLLFLGRLVPGKGVDLLIEAYRRAGLDPRQWPLTIAGDGAAREALRRQAADLPAGGVRFTGFLDGEAKGRALATAKWLVVPSHWQEPFGLVAVEARRLGVPCIVTRDGGLPEAAGDEALMCEPGDVEDLAARLRTATTMPDGEYERRAARTRAAVEREIVGRAFYRAAYHDLVAGRPFAAPAQGTLR